MCSSDLFGCFAMFATVIVTGVAAGSSITDATPSADVADVDAIITTADVDTENLIDTEEEDEEAKRNLRLTRTYRNNRNRDDDYRRRRRDDDNYRRRDDDFSGNSNRKCSCSRCEDWVRSAKRWRTNESRCRRYLEDRADDHNCRMTSNHRNNICRDIRNNRNRSNREICRRNGSFC